MSTDPIRVGLARGWQVTDASRLAAALDLECDVVIAGSGAGGGVSADILSAAGLRVILLEEGPLKSSSDFRMREREAYPHLYQESAARQTRDKGITILQGRSVGGSTTVNWTSSFRTPATTLRHWREVHGLATLTDAELTPWFEKMEGLLTILPWIVPPNENNDVLKRGCEKLGYAAGSIRRNVKNCWNLGYCGMGCPTNAKQSMLVTTIPAALDRGAHLIHHVRVERLVVEGERIARLEAHAMEPSSAVPAVRVRGELPVTIRARHYVLSAGAIGSPAIALRSRLPDPHAQIGRRTFLHPVVATAAIMPNKVEAHSGAPQTIFSDHFLSDTPATSPLGFKLESPPLHPILGSINLQGYGADHAAWMKRFPYLQVTLALMRDGFHPKSQGGQVKLNKDGSPVLDYPLDDYFWEGARRAMKVMAAIQFAAGARYVVPLHNEGRASTSLRDAEAHIDGLTLATTRARVASAHVMGGMAMGADARTSVVDHYGRHHRISNLSVHDGSIFPTSIGANPQLSIYGLTARNASALAAHLGKPPAAS
jgi:choline dehydrogenase-like flavoprotein